MQKYAAVTDAFATSKCDLESDEHNHNPVVSDFSQSSSLSEYPIDLFEEDHYGLGTTQDPHEDCYIDTSLIPYKGIVDIREMNYVIDIHQLYAAYFSKTNKIKKIRFREKKMTNLRE